MKSQRITKVIPVPQGNIIVCTKFHSNPSNIFQDFSLKTLNVNLMVALDEKSGDQQSQCNSSSGDQWKLALHPLAAEIFKSRTKWWTNRHCHPSSHVVSVAKNKMSTYPGHWSEHRFEQHSWHAHFLLRSHATGSGLSTQTDTNTPSYWWFRVWCLWTVGGNLSQPSEKMQTAHRTAHGLDPLSTGQQC